MGNLSEVACDLNILLVEDDSNDVFLMKHALEKNGIRSPLQVVSDGEEALNYLEHSGSYSDRVRYPFPGVILMDLKLPRASGLDVLRWLRRHGHCPAVPTIILSASRIDSDVAEAYRLGATSYFVKPSDFGDLLELVKLMHDYWRRAERPLIPLDC
ncbi:MAG TPA: response regulator [Candidatus Paceibacterota bacterium]|nr:response regulator [Candidatus Paceibacterota bacterium]